jgi:hypothetical protein
MRYTISQLFDALHYCNKFVKTSLCTDISLKKDFYLKKRDLIYHLIRNHKQMQIEISDCRIDMQEAQIGDKPIKLYALQLTKDGTSLRVHQKSYTKLDELFKLKGINFDVIGNYEYSPDDELSFNDDNLSNALKIIEKFHKKWGLHCIATHLTDKNVTNKTVFDSFVYFYPDFSFKLVEEDSKIKNGSVVQVTHKPSRRTYKLNVGSLRCSGNIFLKTWREKAHKFKRCL